MQTSGRRIYYGWYVLAAVSGMSFANGATTIGVLTIFIIPLTNEFGWTSTQIAVATSMGAILGAGMSPITGRLTDRLGARVLLSIGGAIIVVALLGLATVQNLIWFYIAFGLARLSDQGFINLSSPPAVAKWFLRYRGRATAVLFFMQSAGGVVMPMLVQIVIDAFHWRWAWVMLAVIMLVVGLIPTALFVRRQPEDMGLNIDGVGTPESQMDSDQMSNLDDGEEHWLFSEALRNPTLWFLLAAIFGAGVASTGVGLYLAPYLVQKGLSATFAAGAVSISFLAGGAGNILLGYLSEKFSNRLLLLLLFLLKIVTFLVLLRIDGIAIAYGFAVLQGFTEGGMRTISTVLFADYYGRRNLGAIFGLSKAVQVSGFAIGPLISGVVFDITNSFNGAFTAFLGVAVFGTVMVFFARRPVKIFRVGDHTYHE